MSRRPLINVGDLLTACAHIGASDEVTVREIARLLGLTASVEEAVREDLAPDFPPEPPSAPISPAGREDKPRQPGTSSAPPPSLARGEPISIIEMTATSQRPRAPAWLEQKLPPPPPQGGKRAVPLKLEPLFRASWTRNLVASSVATHKPEGPLLLEALVELLGERRPIRSLPRQLRPTLRTGAQVLVDRSETMEPFSRDVNFLLDRIQSVVGRERAQVLSFEGSPQLTGVGSRADWQEHSFQTGVPILALTCLDINAAPHRALATALSWQTFAQAAHDARCPLIAVVPYPPSRWPPELAKRMVILEWDRGTTVGHVRRLRRQKDGTR